MPIEIRTLENCSIEELCESWNRAFSDYKVNIKQAPEVLEISLKQNGLVLAVSIGAFDGDSLVGFWLNGVRDVNGKKIAYDSGTAIWPEYRSKGISKLLSEKSNEALKKFGAKEYQLEVLSDNKKAFDIYYKDGFRISREFVCMKAENNFSESKSERLEIVEQEITPELFTELPAIECSPSWQNSNAAMVAIKDAVKFVGARKNGKYICYGIMQPSRGRISQFACHEYFRSTDIPGRVYSSLCKLTDAKEIAIINIQKDAKQTIECLTSLGFKTFAEQFEMRKLI